MTSWAPATEAEAAMRDALRSGDQELYFRVLARTELVLPVSAEATAGREPIEWGTWASGGRTHLLAFTSIEAMRSCLAQHSGSTRKMAYPELAQVWPNQQWWLAVNPGLPIEGYLPAWFIGQLARGETRLPGPTGGSPNRPGRIEQVDVMVARARATAAVPLRPVPGQPAGASTRPAVFAPPGPSAPPAWPAASASGNAAPAVPAPAARPAVPAPAARPPVPTPAAVPPVPAPAAPPVPTPAAVPPVPAPAARPAVPAPAAAPPVPAPAPPPSGVPAPAGTSRLPRRIPAASGIGGNSPSSAIKDAFGHRAARRPPTAPAQPDRADARPQAAPSSAPPQAAAPSAAPSPDAPATPAPTDRDPAPIDVTSALAALAPPKPAAPTVLVAPSPPETPSKASTPAEAQTSPAAPTSPAVPAADRSEPAMPAFTPANSVEGSLVKAAEEGSTDSFLSTLLLAKVLVPLPEGARENIRPGDPTFLWRTEIVDDQVYVVLFTSPERMAEFFDAPVTSIEVKFLRLIKAWPGASWSFAVNPGSPIGAKLPGAQIVALATWAADVGLTADSGEEPAAAAPAVRPVQEERSKHTVMQKCIPASRIDIYLERGYDRVCGFVHRANEVAHLHTPDELRAALGLRYPGSPFGADEVVYVLRWPAYRPSLYRIPYGGQTEAAMRAMEGWVIQRAPFRGNGFAPGESADVIAEFKVDSVRLPHGAQLWRVRAEAAEELVAVLDADGPRWRRVGDD